MGDDAGKAVYEARLAGSIWSFACRDADVGLVEGLLMARRYADDNRLPWPPGHGTQGRPPSEFQGTCELKRIVEDVFVFNTAPDFSEEVLAEAYEMRQQGATWASVARRVKCHESTVRDVIAFYAAEHCLPPPRRHPAARSVRGTPVARRSMQRDAYERRLLTGVPWVQIAARVGYNPKYKSGYNALEGARRFAKKHGLPWPIPPLDWTAEGTPEQRDSLVYFYRRSGLTWRAIGRLTGYDGGKRDDIVKLALGRHMTRTGLPYPKPADVDEDAWVAMTNKPRKRKA